MKIKILSIIASFFFTALALTSCLDNDETINTSSDVAIQSFSINNIKTTIITETDTTTFTVTGSDYPFTIDQISPIGQIYNVDSLPYNTDVKKVLIKLSTKAYSTTYILKNKEGQDSLCYWNGTDSLNFTNPIKFTTHAYDNSEKTYEIKINVHKVIPDSMVWNSYQSNFPGSEITGGQKAVTYQNKVYVFAETASGVQLTTSEDGRNWSNFEALNNFTATPDYSSVIVFNKHLFILAGGMIYASTDGTNWNNTTMTADALVATNGDVLSGTYQGKFIEFTTSDDPANILIATEVMGADVPADFPTHHYSFASSRLATNDQIERTVLVGETPNNNDTTTIVWAKLSNEGTWADYRNTGIYDCPKLENINLIGYDNKLYVFGGKGTDNKKEVKAFQHFYVSQDNGYIWKPIQRYTCFPTEFLGREESYSYFIDKDNYLWFMWSGSNVVWRGRINRLGFANNEQN